VSVVLAFWATALVIGALALPLSFRLFRRFPDGGAGLSFALGLTLVG
jgi:Kef-type K+ transport system membrane component KefB